METILCKIFSSLAQFTSNSIHGHAPATRLTLHNNSTPTIRWREAARVKRVQILRSWSVSKVDKGTSLSGMLHRDRGVRKRKNIISCYTGAGPRKWNRFFKRVSIHCRWMKNGFNFDDDRRICQPCSQSSAGRQRSHLMKALTFLHTRKQTSRVSFFIVGRKICFEAGWPVEAGVIKSGKSAAWRWKARW